MEEAIRQRINLVVDKSKMSQTAFADAINVVQVTLNRQLKGQRGISLETITSILQHQKDLSAEWLLRGKGSMYITELPHVEMQDGDDKTEELTVELAKMTRKYNEAVSELEELKAEYNKALAQLDWASGIIKESLRKESVQKVG